jgi:hypothetical protein
LPKRLGGDRFSETVPGEGVPKIAGGLRGPPAGGQYAPAISRPAPGQLNLEGNQFVPMYEVLPFPDELEVSLGPKPAWDAVGRLL